MSHPAFPFVVVGLDELSAALALHRPARAVSLLDPCSTFPLLAGVRDHLQLCMLDLTRDAAGDDCGPCADHVRELLAFGASAREDDFTLVHCRAGVSRSAAAALILVAQRFGREQLPNAVDWLWSARDTVDPNPRLLKVADEVMGFNGSLTRAGAVLRKRWRDLHGNPSAMEF